MKILQRLLYEDFKWKCVLSFLRYVTLLLLFPCNHSGKETL